MFFQDLIHNFYSQLVLWDKFCMLIKVFKSGRARWLTPISPALGRPRRVDHEVKRSRPSWSTWWNPISTKNTKISWAWWCTPVVPAIPEAEAGELLEPRRGRLLWAEIVPLHSSLGNNSETPSQKKESLYYNNGLELYYMPWILLNNLPIAIILKITKNAIKIQFHLDICVFPSLRNNHSFRCKWFS